MKDTRFFPLFCTASSRKLSRLRNRNEVKPWHTLVRTKRDVVCDDIMYRPKCDEQEAVLVLHALGILSLVV